MTTRGGLLRWQFDFTWTLFRLHLEALHEDDFRWEPTELVWTVHRDTAGRWRPDFAEAEPDPVPVPTIAWLTWHITWWWQAAMDYLDGRTPAGHETVDWAGSGAATLNRLDELRESWLAVLDRTDEAILDEPANHPWPAEAGLTVAHLCAWVNAELMKNVAEIGQLRMLRAAACEPAPTDL